MPGRLQVDVSGVPRLIVGLWFDGCLTFVVVCV